MLISRQPLMRQTQLMLALAVLLLGACSGSEKEPVSAASASPSAEPEDPSRPLPDPLPDIVARVNSQPIRLVEVVPLLRDELRKYLPGQREEKTPLTLRFAVRRYIDQELLVQEALARGIQADTRAIEKDYDQVRRDHPDEAEWRAHLTSLGFDPKSFKASLRIRHTLQTMVREAAPPEPVSDEEALALYRKNPKAFAPDGATPLPFEVVIEQVKARVQKNRRDEFASNLAAELRAKAKIEIFI